MCLDGMMLNYAKIMTKDCLLGFRQGWIQNGCYYGAAK
jgi:hypothetical protein